MIFDFEVPTKGWNARDNFDNMDSGYAIAMVNLIPENGFLRKRGGTEIYQEDSVFTVPGSDGVTTLAVYSGGSGEQLIAAKGNKLYLVTDETTSAELGTGFAHDKWQTTMFNKYLLLVNGQDNPQQYNGTTLSDITLTLNDAIGTPIPGNPKNTLIGVIPFKNRAYYWPDNEQHFYYCDTAGGYAGDLVQFDISGVAKKGGHIVSMMNYARDTGHGLDDYLVIHMSTGEAIVYEGNDPELDFSLVQTYQIGAPLSIRGNAQFGGDQVIMTDDGFINLSTALPNQQYSRQGNIGDPIINATKRAAQNWGDKFGNEVEFFPKFGFLIFNVPWRGRIDQFVLNTVTGGWCRFTGIDAQTWTVWDGRLMYGDSQGNICEAEKGSADMGQPITYKLITSFSKFGSMSRSKTVTGASITHNYPYGQFIMTDILTDYDTRTETPLTEAIEPVPCIWDSGQWDVDAWGGAPELLEAYTRRDNYPAGANGYAIALKVRGMSSQYNPKIYDLSLEIKKGGIL